VVAKHILRTAALRFDKGVLAEILEPIMGKGLIPADYATWQTRRRALVPAFHAAWLSHMVGLFDHCCAPLHGALDAAAGAGSVIDMEALFCSVSLDIIGLSVFNFGFGSVTQESPVIQAVYRVLREAEHRSTFYFPYWNIPGASYIVPRQIKFRQDMEAINGTLNQLIGAAQATAQSTDLADLEARDYSRVKDPSLLRFLVDLRGESATNAQLRDDLMTMLIAGHETTAAVLTWALFQLCQHPECVQELREELDRCMPGPGEAMTYDTVRKLHLTRLCVAESLRLYPQPPLLIRRALETVELPQGTAGAAVTLPPGADVFIAVYNIHRSSAFWGPDAGEWRPKRFLEALAPGAAGDGGWGGRQPYTPPAAGDAGAHSPLYPNETACDFAYMPFGGGSRKCIGDQFATMEATVVLARIVHGYNFELVGPPGDVGMVTGATIHTEKGLNMRVTKRR
jgi:cytochrome P450